MEVGSWKSEVGSRKSEVGSRKTLVGGFFLSMSELDMTEVFMKTRLTGKDKKK